MEDTFRQSGWKAGFRFFWELIKVFLVAMAIIVPVRYFVVQPFFVRGASMEPNYFDGEYLVIDQLSYRFREPRRGEVIVFRFPERPSQFFIKRIIGLPGEEVRIEEGRVIIRNDQYGTGALVDESGYVEPSMRTGGQITMRLGADEYFVLGDNRAASSDSRSWGVLPKNRIVGRTWVRAFPFGRFSIFDWEQPGFVSV